MTRGIDVVLVDFRAHATEARSPAEHFPRPLAYPTNLPQPEREWTGHYEAVHSTNFLRCPRLLPWFAAKRLITIR